MTDRRAPPRIFSRSRRIAALHRARRRQEREDAARYILDDMVADIRERLQFMRFAPQTALVVGDFTGELSRTLRNDGVTVTEHNVATLDEEEPLPGEPYDFVASVNPLERVNDLPGALVHIHGALARGGIAMISIVGAGSLPKLRRAIIAAEPDRPAARMHPLVDTQSASALMQRAGFSRQVVDSHSLDVAYLSLDRLVSDLRDQGLGNVLADGAPALGKAAQTRASITFTESANQEGDIVELFEILTLTGWKV